MPNLLAKPEKILAKLVDIQQMVANAILIFMMAIITFDVIGRNLFNSPLKGTYELTELSSALLVFFALAITHRVGDHITVDFLTDRFTERNRNRIFGVIEIMIAVVLFSMAKHILDNGIRMMERNATTTDLALPVHPFIFIIAFTILVFMLTAIFKAIAYFRLAVNNE
ncbi:TRAP transporter small permease [Paucisalibacillus globulus]|uniref:TRAP transporter small permease n=1 Tax=Paucisalibacillus globulus TaxID=351095 RepID=UPI000BB89BCF|nr:TRAP transporter small permease [Paucisalibacillus globulus]